MAIGDFHLHSTTSDGVQSPTWVMETAAAAGVKVLALTDHDTTNGLAEAVEAADRLGMQLVPGMELSVDYGKADIHLLAFGFDIHAPALQEFLGEQRDGRRERIEKTVEILEQNEVGVDIKRVYEIAGEATVGRPHVARAMVEAKRVTSVKEAFDKWLGNGKPADVERKKLEPEDAIKLIHDHGGVIFGAHPIFMADDFEAVLTTLKGMGLDGMEVYYKHYTPEQVAEHEAIASRLGLARSGGSDYHGLGNPDDRPIGQIPFPDERVREFTDFLKSKVHTYALGKTTWS